MDIILYIDYIFLIQKSLEKVYSITFKTDDDTVKKCKKKQFNAVIKFAKQRILEFTCSFSDNIFIVFL